MHKQSPFHVHNSANGTKTTTIIVEELVSASEVERKAEGGYCSTLRRVALHLLLRHQVTREGAASEGDHTGELQYTYMTHWINR